MELRLVVLAGAKQGTRIPLKKSKFIIGRAKECTLRAGSEAISRRHCAILRRESGWSVRDLKSRNGTYLNDERIEQETQLKVGDELRVGPLRFRVESAEAASSPSVKSAKTPRSKRPAAGDLAEAARKAAGKSEQTATEDDISRWLLGVSDDPNADPSLKETRTISMQETTTVGKVEPAPPGPAAPVDDSADDDSADLQPIEEEEEDPSKPAADAKSAEKGGWNLLDLVKGKTKKKPGKLPPRANTQPTKDSREAAADLLREMQRRR
jgi:pSer/pThr/pTyr-binding forkhead associated (FHA) protein